MAIVYRYSGEDQRTVVNGTRWKIEISTINTTLWQPSGKATNNLVSPDSYEREIGWIGRPGLSNTSGSVVERDLTTSFGLVVGKVWRVENGDEGSLLRKYQASYVDNWWEESWYAPGGGILGNVNASSIIHWQYGFSSFGYDFSTRVDYYSDLVITYWHPVNGDQLYTLKIFNEDSQIFSRTEPDRPIQVFRRQETCPPDTCSVDCGDHICCYGSDGIATYSYLK